MSTQSNGADPTLVRANRMDLLERVADDLAHEIKNPLHSMVINLEVLRRRISRSSDAALPDLLRYVEVVSGELHRVNNRIELLLRLIRPGRHGEPILFSELLDEVRELIEVEAAKRSVALRLHTEHAATRTYVPRGLAGQVVLTLVLDVLDTLAPGDSLEVRLDRTDDVASVTVRREPVLSDDGGEPADPGALPARPPHSERQLPIAAVLAEALGGQVSAVAEEDDALALTFSFPITG